MKKFFLLAATLAGIITASAYGQTTLYSQKAGIDLYYPVPINFEGFKKTASNVNSPVTCSIIKGALEPRTSDDHRDQIIRFAEGGEVIVGAKFSPTVTTTTFNKNTDKDLTVFATSVSWIENEPIVIQCTQTQIARKVQ